MKISLCLNHECEKWGRGERKRGRRRGFKKFNDLLLAGADSSWIPSGRGKGLVFS
jgi:hypothetical protein